MSEKRTDTTRSEQDRLLDEALAETFPASDPVSMQQMVTVGRIGEPIKPHPAKRRSSGKRNRG
jgi:hypothetical protein